MAARLGEEIEMGLVRLRVLIEAASWVEGRRANCKKLYALDTFSF